MSLGGILLGLIDIAIIVCVMLLIGVIIEWFVDKVGWGAIPPNARNLFIAIVGLVGLYHLVALLLGLPRLRILAERVLEIGIV